MVQQGIKPRLKPFRIRQVEKPRANQHTFHQPWQRSGKVLTIRFNEMSGTDGKIIKQLKGIASESHVSLNQLVVQMLQYCVAQIQDTQPCSK